MMFWIAALSLAGLAAIALVWPLFIRGGPLERGHDAAVYRDQLRELERDRADGLISGSHSDYAKAEIARRLIAASEKLQPVDAPTALPRRPWLLAVVIFLFVPVLGVVLYGELGSPDMPDNPLAIRLANPQEDVNILIAKAEAHLAKHPDDGKGWELLAPIYLASQRHGDAANAWMKVARLLGPTPQRLGNYGEALVVAAKGEITPDAGKAFGEVLELDPTDARARFYLANRLEQQGKRVEALAAFEALLAASRKNDPWLGLVGEHIATLKDEAPPGNPSPEDVLAASGMDGSDRQQMIQGMVEGLDARLSANPDNFEGWMRLINSYMVLKQPDKALAALGRALVAFPKGSCQGDQLIATAKELGIASPEQGQTP